MGSFSIWHWLIVLVIVLLVFGSGKISTMMGDVAGGIKAFKKGMKEEDEVAHKGGSGGTTIEGQATSTKDKKEPVA